MNERNERICTGDVSEFSVGTGKHVLDFGFQDAQGFARCSTLLAYCFNESPSYEN